MPHPPVLDVTITVNPTTHTLSVLPDPFILHKHSDQVVRWKRVPDGTFSVEFENSSPFYESQFSKDNPCSGIARRNVLAETGKIYKYTVKVSGCVDLDPGGGIEK